MSPLEKWQADNYGRISADAFFSDIEVLMVRPDSAASAKLIITHLDQNLAGLRKKAGKAGVTVLVNMPAGRTPNPQEVGPRLEPEITITVIENPLINMGSAGTGKSAEDVVIELCSLLHFFTIRDMGSAQKIAGDAFFPDEGELEKGRIAYQVKFSISMGVDLKTKVVMPKISGSAAAVTIECLTAEAAVYYTEDDSYPWSGNPEATLYTTPFTTAAGTVIRAVAYKENQQASDLAAKTIS